MISNDETLLKSIADVAKELSLEPYVIRYWETQFSQICPIRKSGKRAYTRDNIEIIKKVKELLYDKGFTIKGAQSYLNEEDEEDGGYKDNAKDIVENLTNLRDFLTKFIK